MPIEGSQPLPADTSTPTATPAPATESLRETLTAAFDAVETKAAATETAEPAKARTDASPASVAASPVAAATAASAQTAAPKPDAEGRVRGPDGKFASVKEPDAGPVVSEPPLQRPTSWKKDHWPLWDKLVAGQALTPDEAKTLAKYTHEREGDFVKGVSTYKQSWDGARPVLEALQPYREMLASANATPEQFIKMAGDTHQILTRGTPQDKLREIARFATAYGVPLHELFVQGEDGKIYANQTYFQQAQTTAQPQALTQEDVKKQVDAALAQRALADQIQQFQAAKDGGGNPLYPHYEAVWKTMGGILRAGLAQDLPTAYKVSLTLPQHSDLSPSPAAQPGLQDEAVKKAAAAETARRARASAVSPRNQAPTSTVVAANGARDGLRATLESAFDSHLGSGGRV